MNSINLKLYFLSIISILIVLSSTGSYSNIESAFETKENNSWNFIALGDSRQQFSDWNSTTNHYNHDNSSNPIRRAVFNHVVDNYPNAEFILHSGDMSMNGAEQDDWNRYYEDIENVTKNNISIYYAIGNHETYRYALGPGNYAPAEEDFTTYLANVEMPGNEKFYSFDYNNDIHFVVINTEENWNHGFEITTEQRDWLINDLDINEIPFVVAMFHRPAYSIRDSGRVEDSQSVRAVLEPIFLTYDVDLVFSGHDHYYYRTERNNIMYVTTGGAGANLYTDGDTSEWQFGDNYFSKYHYCNISVNRIDDEIVLKAVVYSFNEIDKTITIEDDFTVTSNNKETSSSSTASSNTSVSSSTPPISNTSFISTLPLIGLFLVLSVYRKRK